MDCSTVQSINGFYIEEKKIQLNKLIDLILLSI
jgi:hypothetical protein